MHYNFLEKACEIKISDGPPYVRDIKAHKNPSPIIAHDKSVPKCV